MTATNRYVTVDKGCVLRKVKAGLMPGSTARAHGVRSECDGYCPTADCDKDHPRVKGKWQNKP